VESRKNSGRKRSHSTRTTNGGSARSRARDGSGALARGRPATTAGRRNDDTYIRAYTYISAYTYREYKRRRGVREGGRRSFSELG